MKNSNFGTIKFILLLLLGIGILVTTLCSLTGCSNDPRTHPGYPYNFDQGGRTNSSIFVVDTVYQFDSVGNSIAILRQIGPEGDIVRVANVAVHKGDTLTFAMLITEQESTSNETKADQSTVEEFNRDDEKPEWEKEHDSILERKIRDAALSLL